MAGEAQVLDLRTDEVDKVDEVHKIFEFTMVFFYFDYSSGSLLFFLSKGTKSSGWCKFR